MIRRAVFLASVCALVACGGSGGDVSAESSSAPSGTLEALAERPGPEVAVIPGTGDHAVGDIRFSFAVIDGRGRAVERPTARVWVARSREQRPFERLVARLEPLGVPAREQHEHDEEEAHDLYVGHVRVDEPGTLWFLAEPVGGRRIQALGNLVVKREPESPPLGARAPASDTPTLGDAPIRELTTRTPPDRELLRSSVAESLRARAPFVVTFATPKFCSSRTCGPVMDVVDRVRRRFEPRGIRFIHVEVYKGNDPARGVNRWMVEWGLPSEPWTFLVGRDGRIKGKFEGSLSVRELTESVRRSLLPR
ncbi:MAG: hypothetical protein ABR583_00965 [Gaiellaceae bacterium]